jgi:hypothetical protein
MAAVAFAEEGEFETAQRFISPEADKAGKKVVLSLDDPEIKPQLIKYALDLCRRVGGQLEVLHILKQPGTAKTAAEFFLNPMVEKLREMGVKYDLIVGNVKPEDELVRQTENRRNILFVVLDSISRTRDLDNDGNGLNVVRIMNKLNCPVVVFSDKT